jgi:hypothetical protein
MKLQKVETNQYKLSLALKSPTAALLGIFIIADYSTKGALPSLTLEIERDPVCFRRCGRSWKVAPDLTYKPLL